MLTVVRPFYQASFQLGHPVDVDNAESIEWPDGVEAKQEVHKTKGAEGTQLSVKFPEPHMATVNIFPCGKVEVSTASSEKAARQSMATVSSAFREAGCAPRDNVTTPENTFRITNITAKFEKPGSTLIIHQEQTKEILESKFMSVVYEPELKQRLTLKVKTTGYAEVTFRFNVKTIDVWGKELEEMERLFHENVYDCVTWKEAPTPAGVQGANGGGKTAAVKQPCTRTALDLAVKKDRGKLACGAEAKWWIPEPARADPKMAAGDAQGQMPRIARLRSYVGSSWPTRAQTSIKPRVGRHAIRSFLG